MAKCGDLLSLLSLCIDMLTKKTLAAIFYNAVAMVMFNRRSSPFPFSLSQRMILVIIQSPNNAASQAGACFLKDDKCRLRLLSSTEDLKRTNYTDKIENFKPSV